MYHQRKKEILLFKKRSILFLKIKKSLVSPHVAPGLTYIDIMLPYTHFQYLLFSLDKDLIPVMTSGNLSEEPVCFKDESAFEQLGNIADYFVIYKQEIVAYSDDSVMFVINETPVFIRRLKGFVPAPILRKNSFPVLFCFRRKFKKFFCLSKG